MTTFTYSSSSYLFYGLCLICQCNLSCQQSNNSGGASLQTMSALYSLKGELKENQPSQNWLQSCSFSFHRRNVLVSCGSLILSLPRYQVAGRRLPNLQLLVGVGSKSDHERGFLLVLLLRPHSNPSVSDPDPYAFVPPGSRSVSQRYGSGSGSLIIKQKQKEKP